MSDDKRVYIFDSTLRDGAQTQGVDFNVTDKFAIAQALDELGIDYVEGGWPGANPTDDAFFADPPAFETARLVAFAMTRRAGRSTANDPGLAGLTNAKADCVCMVGKTWDFHVDVALGIAPEENLAMIADSVAHMAERKAEVLFDAEHFFDGFKSDRDYALKCVTAAYEAGARWVVLCDTNGGTLPDEVERIVGEVTAVVPGSHLGIHCHNDTESAVAGSLAAVCAGAYCLSSNLWNPPGSSADCGGLGWIVSPDGDILAQTDPDAPFATIEVDLEYARRSKTTYPRYVPE